MFQDELRINLTLFHYQKKIDEYESKLKDPNKKNKI